MAQFQRGLLASENALPLVSENGTETQILSYCQSSTLYAGWIWMVYKLVRDSKNMVEWHRVECLFNHYCQMHAQVPLTSFPTISGFLDMLKRNMFILFPPSVSQKGHTWWGRGIRASDLQPSVQPFIIRTGVQAGFPEPNSMKLLRRTKEAPPQLLPEYFSSSGMALCHLALDLPETPWTSLWGTLSIRIMRIKQLFYTECDIWAPINEPMLCSFQNLFSIIL